MKLNILNVIENKTHVIWFGKSDLPYNSAGDFSSMAHMVFLLWKIVCVFSVEAFFSPFKATVLLSVDLDL